MMDRNYNDQTVSQMIEIQLRWNMGMIYRKFGIFPAVRHITSEHFSTYRENVWDHVELLYEFNLFDYDSDNEYFALETLRCIGVDDIFLTSIPTYNPMSPYGAFRYLLPTIQGEIFDLEFIPLYDYIQDGINKFFVTLARKDIFDIWDYGEEVVEEILNQPDYESTEAPHLSFSESVKSEAISVINYKLTELYDAMTDVLPLYELMTESVDEIKQRFPGTTDEALQTLGLIQTYRECFAEVYDAILIFISHRLKQESIRVRGLNMGKIRELQERVGDQIFPMRSWKEEAFTQSTIDRLTTILDEDRVPSSTNIFLDNMQSYLCVLKK